MLWAVIGSSAATPPTRKPSRSRPIENSSAPGDVVYEPFLGSGTTIVAAENCARICRAVEISPEHVDVAIARFEQLTGTRARLL